jgi:hypothetical protein
METSKEIKESDAKVAEALALYRAMEKFQEGLTKVGKILENRTSDFTPSELNLFTALTNRRGSE